MDYIHNGILANYLNYTVPGYGIYSNNMQNAVYGFWLNAGGEIGHQYFNTTAYSADNQWSNCTNETMVNSGCNNYGVTGASFYTRNTSPYNITNPGSGGGPSLTGITATGGFAGTCSSSSTPTLNLRTNGNGNDGAMAQYAQEIANGSMSFSENNESTKQNARQMLYRQLNLKQIDLNVKDDFSAFMNAERLTSTGTFFTIDSLINTGDSVNIQKAFQYNNSINAVTDVDRTQQQLNKLYINYLNSHRKLTAADVLAMETIAELCPNTHGSAVHQARSILFNITYKKYGNACEFDNDQKKGRFAAKQPTQASGIKLYPNPNNGTYIIETGTDTNYTLEVYNVLGEMVAETIITGKQEVDMHYLPSATYIIKIRNGKTILKTDRISIIH